MKKFFKILGYFAAIFVIFVIGAAVYVGFAYPKIKEAPNMTIDPTPERLERGKFLANGPAGCIHCHSVWDKSKFSNPVTPGTEGMGGEDIGTVEGTGPVFAKNITQDKETGIGSWTDGEIFRAVTSGVDKNGKALAPVMPYIGFGQMDEEDVKSVIAYIKTLKPIKNTVHERKLIFPLSFFVKMIPTEPKFTKRPDPNNKVALGQYYSGACFICHTQVDGGKPIMEKYLAGGREFPLPDGSIVRSANLTPDKETGTGNWTKEQFLSKFRMNKDVNSLSVKDRGYATVMPWNEFANGYSEDDLGAVFDYLQTIQPVTNKVEKIGLQGMK